MMRKLAGLAIVGAAALGVSGCQDEGGLNGGRAYAPIPERTLAMMDEIGTTKYSPVLLRAFKKESELELWKMKADGTYALLKTYPMCRWSGQLGPKRREGDRQVPEGFYYITAKRMNPNSAYYLSFNVGYPNAFDRAHGRTGSHIMVHGACSSRGCFSMTDQQIAEIYAVLREAFTGGQKAVQMQSLPFRMTPKNLAKHRLDKNIKFWKALKEGSDTFEVAKREPQVLVCNRKYVFNAQPANTSMRVNSRAACPPLTRNEALVAAVKKKESADQTKVAALVSKGVHPVKVVYADGGQHKAFAYVSMVSRPDALARGPVEIALDSQGRPMKTKPVSAKAKLAVAGGNKDATANGTGSAKAKVAANTTVKTKANGKRAAGVPQQASAFAPQTPASTKAAKAPLLKRWLGGLMGGGPSSQKAVVPTAASPAAETAPAPPRRKSVSTPAARKKLDKSAALLPKIITGAQAPLPTGLTAYAPVR
ncbi:MAG: murein L,D-transpeptidase [Hyphomicrobiales bacterium]|nr:murein L,D-transpeptidase [Hyphomicrobiales bacterium]